MCLLVLVIGDLFFHILMAATMSNCCIEGSTPPDCHIALLMAEESVAYLAASNVVCRGRYDDDNNNPIRSLASACY